MWFLQFPLYRWYCWPILLIIWYTEAKNERPSSDHSSILAEHADIMQTGHARSAVNHAWRLANNERIVIRRTGQYTCIHFIWH